MDGLRREFLRNLALFIAMAPTVAVKAAALPPGPAGSAAPVAWTRTRPVVTPKIVRTHAELIAARLVPPVDRKNVRKTDLAHTPNPPGKWPGAYGGAMGATGEREEIGLVTEDIARWLIGAAGPSDMLVWAETHGLVPVHYTIDGKIVDITKYPNVSAYERKLGGVDPWFDPASATTIKPDTAHYPAVNYVPYLATRDPYYLEELQYQANYCLLNHNPAYRGYERGLLREDQTRGYAWNLRDIACAWIATAEAEARGERPDHLLPAAHWKRILDNNRDTFRAKWVNNGVKDPVVAGCHWAVHLLRGGRNFRPWMQDMLGFVLGWMIWTGKFDDWRANYEWHMQQAIWRSDGAHGLPRTRGVTFDGELTGVTDLASFAKVNNWTQETADGTYPAEIHNVYAEYIAYHRANLRMAVLNGIAEAKPGYDWVDAQARKVPARWAV